MPAPLPPNPSLEHLKKQAKALLRAVRAGDPDVVARFEALGLRAAPKLADAQRLVAREHGFASWAKLKSRVETSIPQEVLREAVRVFQENDAEALRRLLERHPALKGRINEPVAPFDAPPIVLACSKEMLDVLVEAGADLNARSGWWAGGFGVLDSAPPEVAAHAIRRGAAVDVHAAARLGLIDRLRELIDTDPSRARARGPDGRTPLHAAATVEIAAYLLDRGAEIDARDVDHESTPAQYMVRSRPDVARYLIRRGCATDILMAAALGDADLAERHLRADPDCIHMRVSDEFFPMVDSGRGGTIYQWELGWYVSARQVAHAFGHLDLFARLMDVSPPDEKLVDACWLHDEEGVDALLVRHPNLAATLAPAARRNLAHAARNDDTAAARLMLRAGLPATGAASQHGASALHWAAWHGNVELVRLLLQHDPPLDDTNNEFGGTPLAWAIHGSENSWERGKGDHAATVETLASAGSPLPDRLDGTEAVRAVLLRHGVREA